MTTRDAEATRARILRAAAREFADHGLAGGRVDRIAAAAGANVRMIYAYFGDKAGLFDAAVSESLRSLAATVPLRPDDLPGWAVDVFDHHQGDASALRLALWAHLERPEASTEPAESYRAKVELVGGPDAVDLIAFVYALTQAWLLTPSGLLAADGSDPGAPERVAAHRRALATAVRRLTTT